MRILLFEWLTGGGQWISQEVPHPSCQFQQQGQSMLTTLARDFDENGVALTVLVDSRMTLDLRGAQTVSVTSAQALPELLRQQAETCDWVLLIAPELDDCLLHCCQWLGPLEDKLISPNQNFVRLAADKQRTLEHLGRLGVPVPAGCRLSQLNTNRSVIGLPAVVKPIDGAGSEQVQLIRHWSELEDFTQRDQWRVESFVPGHPVSVSVLCGNQDFRLLPPTGQQFDRQPFGIYIGSVFPLPSAIAKRATELAGQAMHALPRTRGYLGIDMVIPDPIAHPDHPAMVIEVNPRLTMSYVKLSQLMGPALVQEMLELATETRSPATDG